MTTRPIRKGDRCIVMEPFPGLGFPVGTVVEVGVPWREGSSLVWTKRWGGYTHKLQRLHQLRLLGEMPSVDTKDML